MIKEKNYIHYWKLIGQIYGHDCIDVEFEYLGKEVFNRQEAIPQLNSYIEAYQKINEKNKIDADNFVDELTRQAKYAKEESPGQ